MRRFIMPFLSLFYALPALAQFPQIDYRPNLNGSIAPRGTSDAETILELLDGGQLEVYTSGSTQAAVQVLKLRIGEKDGFNIPLFLTVGNSGTSFGDLSPEKRAIATLLNPVGGILNASFLGARTLYSSGEQITKLHFSSQGATKFLYAEDTTQEDGLLLPAGYLDFGFLFQTGLWEQADYEGGGVFWIQLKYSLVVGPEADYRRIFAGLTEAFIHGTRVDLGMVLKDRVNVRIGAFFPSDPQGIDALDKTVIKFAFDYRVGQD